VLHNCSSLQERRKNDCQENKVNTRFDIANDKEALAETGVVKQLDVHCQSAEVCFWIGEAC